MIFPTDIHDLIVSFMDNFNDLLSWRHLCRDTFHDYTATFYCHKMYPFIITPLVDANEDTNVHLLSRRTYVKSLIINNYTFKDEHLMNLKNLESLQFMSHIYGMSMSSFAFANLTKLQKLICSNSICLNDNALSKLTSLTQLNCNNCQNLSAKSLSKLVNLTILNCEGIPRLDMSFVRNLTKLECLTISSSIQDDKESLGSLVNLKHLHISKLSIKPDSLKWLPKLEYLNCGDYDYTDEHIMHLSNLTILICRKNCFFTDLSLSNLTKLESFKINNADLIISEEVFNKLVHLMELNCGKVQMSDNVIKNFNKLISLQCEDNLLLTDEAIKHLPNLTELDCGRNENFTDAGLIYLQKLEILNCGSNTNITDLTLYNLSEIISLSCGFNRNFGKGLQMLSNKLHSIEWIHKSDDESMNPEFIKMVRSIKNSLKKRSFR